MIFVRFVTGSGMIFADVWKDAWKNSASIWNYFFDDCLLLLAFSIHPFICSGDGGREAEGN